MLDLLSKDRIVDEAGLRAALYHLDAVSSSGAARLQATVERMLSSPYVFAYIISVWDRREAMISQIVTNFPTKSQEYLASIARKMLDTLSMYFSAFPVESLPVEVSRDIGRHKGFIEGALPALCALSIMKFDSEKSFENETDLFNVEFDDGFVKKVPQKFRKRNRQKAHTATNTSLFVRLGVAAPPTSEAATSLTSHILAELKNILSFYLSLLRRTELADDIKALLFPNVGESAKDAVPGVSSTEDVESLINRPNAYPMVQPMKAALYFDNVDGFGEWRILISTEACKNLREFHRADGKIFKIIVKKIKQLSNGYFSDDNHKRLNGPDAGIPIHKARMTKDLHLVYQIDCVPDQDGKSERQVIKVYGIYTHTQLGRIWDALGSHLARKGKEHRRRCIFRNRPFSNDSMILPASFPLAEPEPNCSGNPIDLSDKDMDRLKTAEGYPNAQEFEQSAKRYCKAGRFDKTLHVLGDHGMNMPEETTAELWTVCRLFYCSRNNTQAPLSLFSTFDEELEFLEDYNLDYARTSLLESHSRYYEAAELHLSENRPLEAVRAFIKDNSNVDSTIRAADTIMEYFWRKCSFRITAKTTLADEPMRHFIALADQLETNKLTPETRDLISMFRNILRGNHEPLRNLALAFHEHNKPAALLCLDHVFSGTTDIRTFAVDEMQRFLQQFHAYARLLYLILTFPDPMEHGGIQRLFSIVRLSGDEFLIPDGTFLHSCVMEIRQGITLVSEHPSGYTASRRNVTQLLQRSIRTILKDKVSEIDAMCCKSPVFSQCLQFLISGVCRRDDCPQEHVPISKLDRLYYNSRVAIHIWQILILQIMYSAHPYIERRNSMRDWLKHLYEAINPPFFIQGSPADLDMNLMPLRLDCMRVVKLWIRESFYSLDPFFTKTEFLTALMEITSLSFAFDRHDAPVYISRAKYTASGPLELFRKWDGRYMVHDLLSSYQGATRSSISSGIVYLLHVLDNRLYANLSVLCDCIEDICSGFVIKLRMDPDFNKFPLHDVVLPCNWLLFPHKFTAEKDTKLFFMGKLLDEIAKLVEALRVEAGMEFLWLNHTKFTPILRNVFISRICRVLCLIAHNIRNRFMKDKVDKIMLSLYKNNPPSNWRTANYRKLVDDVVEHMTPLPGRAPFSDGYLRALLAFDNNTGVSNLVHLVHKTMDQRTRVHPIRRLLYEKVIEIPHLLSSYAVIAQSTPIMDGPAIVPRLEHSKDRPEVMQHDEKVMTGMTEPQPQEFEGEEENEEDVTANADTETRDALGTLYGAVTLLAPDFDESLRSNGPSVEEEDAARKIQNAYRRYVIRRSSRAVNAEIDVIFMTCLKETQSSEWRPGYYNFLFLGPLPHLLVCLERGIALTRAAKAKTKGLLNKESHKKLEELGKQRSEIAELLKKGSKLRKQLEPSSPAHRAHDIDALKRGVVEVKEFMQSVPGNMQDMQSEFQMAYKGIVAEKKIPVPKEKERPILH